MLRWNMISTPVAGTIPRNFILVLFFLGITGQALAQQDTVISYLATGYKYLQVPGNQSNPYDVTLLPVGFQLSSFDESGWSMGDGGFGTASGGCPLNSPTFAKTNWDVWTQILLRKHVNLPAGTQNLIVSIAIDNDVQVFFNGQDVSGGINVHEGCASRGSFNFPVPNNVLNAGDNLLVVRGVDRGGLTYLDAQVTAVLPPYTVINTLDAGNGSLRAAITQANAHLGLDTIRFAISGSGVQTISVQSPLPSITDPVLIDGYTQPGAQPNTLLTGNNAVLLIELSGSPSAGSGLTVSSANTTVRGLVINDFPGAGIALHGSNSTITGNFIGADPTGTQARGNGTGIYLLNATNTLIGGASASARNVISGNVGDGVGIWDGCNGVQILGNYIGVQADGTSPLGNSSATQYYGSGVSVRNYASNITLGGLLPGQGNVIGYNTWAGFAAFSGSSMTIQGNTIRQNAAGGIFFGSVTGPVISGNSVLSNTTDGVYLYYSPNATIGGTTPAERNIILGNTGNGIRLNATSTGALIRGNFIGTDTSGAYGSNYQDGIKLEDASSTSIGGLSPGQGNVIRYNYSSGVEASNGSGLTIFGNTISNNSWHGIEITSVASPVISGNSVLSNQTEGYADGVHISNSANARIGGTTRSERNIISGNSGYGISLAGSDNALIQGNSIGTDSAGALALGNGRDGVRLLGARYTSIGGTVPGAGNLIAFNQGAGVGILNDNSNERSAYNNSILSNAIYSNVGPGIDLGGDGEGNPSGTNNSMNAPVLALAAFNLGGVQGSVSGTPNTTYSLQFFLNNKSLVPQGAFLFGTSTVTTGAGGDTTFSVSLPGLIAGTYVSATATDPNNNTSEFSALVPVVSLYKYYGPHFVVNTTFAGIPLHWPNGKAKYHLSSTIPSTADNFQQAIRSSFNAWAAAPPVLLSENTATAADYHIFAGDLDGVNNVVWVSTDNGAIWPSTDGLDPWTVATDGADPNIIALTRVRYDAVRGEITDADIAINAVNPLFLYKTDGSTLGYLDLQNVITHEAGHFIGLGDEYNPGDPAWISLMGTGNEDVTMYGVIKGSSVTGVVETKKRTLELPDIAGIAYMYGHIPASAASGVDAVLLFDGSTSFASTYQGFNPAVQSAQKLVLSMRDSDRVAIVQLPGTTVRGVTTLDTAGRALVLAAIQGLAAGGSAGIGQGLQTGATLLTAAPSTGNQKAMILFSAGEENGSPSALSASVIASVRSAGARLYTMGFNTSSGQNLSSSLADSTGGAYYLASDGATPGGIATTDSTMTKVVGQMWTKLTGLQLKSLGTIASGGFEFGNGFVNGQPGFVNGQPGFVTGQPGIVSGQPGIVNGQPGIVNGQPGFVSGQPGIVNGQPGFVSGQPGIVSGQPAFVDLGTTVIVPAVNAGSGSGSLPKALNIATATGTKVQLGLIVPFGAYPVPGGSNQFLDPGTGQIKISPLDLFDIYGVIFPESIPFIPKPNYQFTDIQYVQGDNYGYYIVKNPRPGKWSLISAGDPTNVTTSTVPVTFSVTAGIGVNMGITLNKSSYVVGDSIKITATLVDGGGIGNQTVDIFGSGNPGGNAGGGPITNATVKVYITSPTGVLDSLPLPGGNGGIYSGTFGRTSAVGSYNLRFSATGPTPGSLTSTFDLRPQQSVYVKSAIVPDAVVFATRSAQLLDSSNVISGSVIVNGTLPATSVYPKVELTIGRRVSTPQNYNLRAKRITLNAGATISSNLNYNTLTNSGGTISGGAKQTSPFVPVATLPVFKTGTPGTTPVSVGLNKSATLAAGNWGDIVVLDGGKLTFTGGTYNVKSITAGNNVKLLFGGTGGKSEVRIANRMLTGIKTMIGPAQGSGLDASKIVFYVAGSDGPLAGLPTAVNIGPLDTVLANFYVPNGTFWILAGSRATGSFLAKDVIIGIQTQLTLANAFTGLVKDDAEDADISEEGELPKTFALDQNYPNPFNPTTTISYQLPEPRDVTLVVYNILGQTVRSLVSDAQAAGRYSFQWDGRNDFGTTVSTGVYFFRLKAGDFVDVKKMMFLK